MLGWYREKFGIEDIGHLLYALAYFDDAEVERMPRMISRVSWRHVRKTLADCLKTAR